MPKIVNHKEYKRQLLSKAAEIFVSKSYADVSMRDIAGDLNVSTGTLYHYFHSKEDLFCALFLYNAQISASEIIDKMCHLNSFSARVEILFDYFLHRCEKMARQFLLSTDMLRNDLPDKAQSLLHRWASEMERRLSQVLGIERELGLALFLFFAGSLYAGQVLPASRDLTPGFNAMKKLILQNNIKGDKNEK